LDGIRRLFDGVNRKYRKSLCHCERSEAISLHHSLFLVRRRPGPALTDSIFTTTFTFLLVLFLIAAPAHAKYGGGTGGPNDPYLIFTAEQMNEIGLSGNWDDWDKHFKLMADIDLSAFTGTSFNIIPTFSGVFDGSGHTISNFTYTSTDTDYIGLFGLVDGEDAVIKDLGLLDPNVDAGTGTYVGALIGQLGYGGGTITNCYVEIVGWASAHRFYFLILYSLLDILYNHLPYPSPHLRIHSSTHPRFTLHEIRNTTYESITGNLRV